MGSVPYEKSAPADLVMKKWDNKPCMPVKTERVVLSSVCPLEHGYNSK